MMWKKKLGTSNHQSPLIRFYLYIRYGYPSVNIYLYSIWLKIESKIKIKIRGIEIGNHSVVVRKYIYRIFRFCNILIITRVSGSIVIRIFFPYFTYIYIFLFSSIIQFIHNWFVEDIYCDNIHTYRIIFWNEHPVKTSI